MLPPRGARSKSFHNSLRARTLTPFIINSVRRRKVKRPQFFVGDWRLATIFARSAESSRGPSAWWRRGHTAGLCLANGTRSRDTPHHARAGVGSAWAWRAHHCTQNAAEMTNLVISLHEHFASGRL